MMLTSYSNTITLIFIKYIDYSLGFTSLDLTSLDLTSMDLASVLDLAFAVLDLAGSARWSTTALRRCDLRQDLCKDLCQDRRYCEKMTHL